MATYYVGQYPFSDNDIRHYRTRGSRNGVRLYQYEDGSLTPAGKARYLVGEGNSSGSGNLTVQSQLKQADKKYSRKKHVVGKASSSSMETHGSGIGSSGPQIKDRGKSATSFASDIGKNLELGKFAVGQYIESTSSLRKHLKEREDIYEDGTVEEYRDIQDKIKKDNAKREASVKLGKKAAENIFNGIARNVKSSVLNAKKSVVGFFTRKK